MSYNTDPFQAVSKQVWQWDSTHSVSYDVSKVLNASILEPTPFLLFHFVLVHREMYLHHQLEIGSLIIKKERCITMHHVHVCSVGTWYFAQQTFDSDVNSFFSRSLVFFNPEQYYRTIAMCTSAFVPLCGHARVYWDESVRVHYKPLWGLWNDDPTLLCKLYVHTYILYTHVSCCVDSVQCGKLLH